ncbi:MAG: c-type cytochrome [Pirellulaceae bacterium]
MGRMLIFICVCCVVTSPLAADDQLHNADQPLPPREAAESMVVPTGFHVRLFAGEPDVMQPIGFCVDDRARLWVAEAYNYPVHGTQTGDRIVILEDVDGDGHFDRRKVFFDKLNYVTGIEVGFGGAWVMSPPNLLFIPDADSDGVPDSEPQVLLDGFGNHANAHNLANGFAWGPDGWLYGTHGRTNWSLLGKPGTPDEQRVRFDGGVYRYHPVRHVWEPYADGTTNPWGIDWNDYGEAFVCNCVNPHLFHVIAGAHYEPWRNRESSRFAYERIPTIADHLHFVGVNNVRDGLGSAAEDSAGGGHAHCGTLIYLGDNWPPEYRNSLFTNNIHGRRINNDILARHGSGYVASHGADLMRSRDPWFMGVTLQSGPAGEVYASDWSDTGECHSIRNTQRQTGRIFRITYGDIERPQVNLAACTDAELVAFQMHANDWYVRHARRVLHERQAAGQDMTHVAAALRKQFDKETATSKQLRALWALHVISKVDELMLDELMNMDDEYLRAWGVRLACEMSTFSEETLADFARLAGNDPSQLVRLHLTSGLQRLPAQGRWEIAAALASHAGDASDANLPLMLWYGIEPLVQEDLSRFIQLGTGAQIPLIQRHVARRVVDQPEFTTGLELICQAAASVENNAVAAELLQGLLDGLDGRRAVSMPPSWPRVFARFGKSERDELASCVIRLALLFDDPHALRTLRTTAADPQASTAARTRAITALVSKRSDDLPSLLLALIDDHAVQSAAIRGLAEFEDERTGAALINSFVRLDNQAQQDALLTLASRKTWAAQLMTAIESGRLRDVPLTAYTARQLHSLGDERITATLRRVWGEIRETNDERAALLAATKKQLTPAVLASANLAAGRAVFDKQCASCHMLFGEGGKIGPDITGAQRMNLDYLLENLIDPSAAVAKDFQMEIIETSNGRVVSGLVTAESSTAATITTVNDRVVIPQTEIESRKISSVSMMPDGMLKQLTADQIRDLIGYLQSTQQVPK